MFAHFAILYTRWRRLCLQCRIIMRVAKMNALFPSELDFINLIAYDWYGSWMPVIGLHSALYPRTSDPYPSYNQDSVVNTFANAGMPLNKTVLGQALHGRSFVMTSPSQNQPGDTYATGGPPGPIVKQSGLLGYIEVSSLFTARV